MKMRSFSFLLFVALLLVTPIEISAQNNPPPQEWVEIAPRIEYREYHLPTPVNVYVTRMARAIHEESAPEQSNVEVTIESSIAQGKLISGVETVSGMARRYDQSLNYWGETWGNRNRVVVAINGFYFGPSHEPPGVPWSGQVQSGWYAKRFSNVQTGSGFAWLLNGDAFIGECVTHFPDKQVINFISNGTSQRFHGINIPRKDNQLIVYTSQFNDHTNTDSTGLEVLVELSNPVLIMPVPNMITGYVREIRDQIGSTTIPFDHIVLSAHGTARDNLLSHNLQIGDQIGISQEIKSYREDCTTPLALDWTKTYASIGGDFYFLRNGLVYSYSSKGSANVRDPRTAIAYNDDYIFFIVVDGRDPFTSLGMSIRELAVFARDTLGATYGIAQDGGGSSTMVVNGQVMNNTFCNHYYCKAKLYIPVTIKTGPQNQQVDGTESRTWTPLPQTSDNQPPEEPPAEMAVVDNKIQRLVANGMMMVVVEPISQSLTFVPGQTVITTTQMDVRLGPDTNYKPIATIAPGTEGVILSPLNNLNGVLAKGSHWWKVGFGDKVGWVTEQSLAPKE